MPSEQDRDVTRRLRQAGDLLGIELLDHIVIGQEGFAQRGDFCTPCWATSASALCRFHRIAPERRGVMRVRTRAQATVLRIVGTDLLFFSD